MIEMKDLTHPAATVVQGIARFWKPTNLRGLSASCTVALSLMALVPAAAQDTVIPASQAPSGVASSPAGSIQKPSSLQHGSVVLAYWYGPDYHTPFVLNPNTDNAASIARNSIEFTSVGSWGVLTNFSDVVVNLSNMAEPANSGGSGATEAYVILRPAIDLNELGHSDAFKKGVLRDITFEMGANFETKNSSYAPSEKTIYIGPKLAFAMPKGFFNVGLHFRKEWNHEGVLGKSESYDPDFNFEPTWLLPFKVGKAHFAFSGFADYNTPKGKDSFGSQMVSEFLVPHAECQDTYSSAHCPGRARRHHQRA